MAPLQPISSNGYGLTSLAAVFPTGTTVWKMLEYRLDSEAPVPFAVLLNADSELIRLSIVGVSLPAQVPPLVWIGDEIRMDF